MRSSAALLWLLAVAASASGVSCAASAPPPPASAGSSAAPAAAPVGAEEPRGEMTEPGLAAAPCTSDAMCMNHRCNLQYGKCAFPCASDADCVRGSSCFRSAISTCQVKPPGQP